ncbi:hypothetical protein Tco_1497067 [Tanacetum coccineum]
MFDNNWRLEPKEVSPQGEELSLFDRPNKVERGRILEAHRLESILQQQISQCMAPSHHDASRFTRDAVTTTSVTMSVRIFLTASNAQVIFDEKKLGSA